MSFLPPDAAQIFESNSGARLTIYGGFLLDDGQIKSFLAAQQPEVRLGRSPANDIHQWLLKRGLPVFLEPCRVRPPECEDNPALALIYFTQETVRYADVDLTDVGVVPLKPHEPTDGEKERVRRWLQLPLEPAEADAYDAHVTDLAQRIFYFDVEPSDSEITEIFEHIAQIVRKAPREVQFSIVYNWDQMVDIKGHEDYLNKMYQQIMESQQADDAADVSGQTRG